MEIVLETDSSQNIIVQNKMETKSPRLLFIDNLRWLMIILVVIMHLNVTYSSLGSWYYVEKRPLDVLSLILGGLHWQSAAYALWESFFCVGVCLGLLVLFREKYNTQGRLSRFLSENAFGVYVFHAPILVALSMVLRNITTYPLLKMILVSIITLPVCFGFSYLVRKIPWFKSIFS